VSYRDSSLVFGALVGLALACSDSSGPTTRVDPLDRAGNADNVDTAQGGTSSGAASPTLPAGSGDFAMTGDDSAACASAIFCDGFEDAAVDVPPSGMWTATQNNGTVRVDASRPFRGTHAVKATTLATAVSGQTYKQAFIGLAGPPVIPLLDDKVYGRMMFYLESVPSTSLHWTIIDGKGLIPGQDYSATYRYGGQKPVSGGSQWMANYDTTDFFGTPPKGPNTDCYQHAQGKVAPVGKWSCAEWYFDGQNNQMRFWLDGTELTDLAVNGTGEGCVGQPVGYPWTAPTFSRLDVGWESYAADEERSIWIDDVVISQTQVGCPARE
jgi:hypothetical protein